MRVTRVLHCSVNVEHRLEDSSEFYRHFALDEIDRPDIPGIDGAWFAAGATQLHLVDAPAGTSGIRPAGPHICFGVDDLAAAVAELEAGSVPYLQATQGATEQIWITDPAGNTIELQQDPNLA